MVVWLDVSFQSIACLGAGEIGGRYLFNIGRMPADDTACFGGVSRYLQCLLCSICLAGRCALPRFAFLQEYRSSGGIERVASLFLLSWILSLPGASGLPWLSALCFHICGIFKLTELAGGSGSNDGMVDGREGWFTNCAKGFCSFFISGYNDIHVRSYSIAQVKDRIL